MCTDAEVFIYPHCARGMALTDGKMDAEVWAGGSRSVGMGVQGRGRRLQSHTLVVLIYNCIYEGHSVGLDYISKKYAVRKRTRRGGHKTSSSSHDLI
jgi:hypothetical protein